MRLILIAFSIGCLIYIAQQKPVLTGDAREYYLTAESFANHLSPELRPTDIQSIRAQFAQDFQEDLPDQPFGYFLSRNGELYSYHFWLYSFTSLPAQFGLKWAGADPLRAFAWTNLAFFLAALWSIVLFFRGGRAQKLAFLGLSALNPVLFYLGWTHPEVWSFALVTFLLVCFSRRNLTGATLFAALAATQNPPLLFLAGFYILLRLWDLRRDFRVGKAIGACLAGAPAAAPMLFYYLHYGTPNLILQTGMADPKLASLSRLADLYLDLNMGMLPYIPLAWRRRPLPSRRPSCWPWGRSPTCNSHPWRAGLSSRTRPFTIRILKCSPSGPWDASYTARPALRGISRIFSSIRRATCAKYWPTRLTWNIWPKKSPNLQFAEKSFSRPDPALDYSMSTCPQA